MKHGNDRVGKQLDGRRRASARNAPFSPHGGAEPGSLLGGLPYFICALVLALAAFIAYRHFISVTSADPNKGNRGKES